MSLRVLLTDRPWPDDRIERGILTEAGIELIEAPSGDEATLARLSVDCQAIMTCWAKVTQTVMAASPECRHVARLGIGLDNIDVAYATTRNIVVTNIPDYCIEEVVDHALALLLGLARNVAFHHLRTKRGIYELRSGQPLRRIAGQTLGLFGFGRTGQLLARKAQGIGLTVVAHSASGDDRGTGIEMVSREELFRRSDFLSLHAPLTPQTRHAINAESLPQMKPHVVIVNTSRGGLIDHAALWRALQENRVGGVGLDVFDPEPPNLADPLFSDERVIATPHIAFVSEESLINLRERTARQIVDTLQGRVPENVINPQVLLNR
ncbi:MAG: C-terminal binding protein [Planctomycetota bacterium]|nr:MAG: C-terminal binding protein [Planctomycetota bacterium]